VSTDQSPGVENVKDQEQIRDAIRLTCEERFAEALPLFEQLLPRLGAGTISDKRLAASAFSYYGVCVAMVRRRYAEAVKYCKISLRSNFLDPDHRYNLAKVYLERNDRRRAVEALNAGLRLNAKHRRLNSMFNELGRRRPPVIPFLPRGNALNIWLGKMLRKPKKRR
jgi:tetratricopeptide (TPR) repeat protein